MGSTACALLLLLGVAIWFVVTVALVWTGRQTTGSTGRRTGQNLSDQPLAAEHHPRLDGIGSRLTVYWQTLEMISAGQARGFDFLGDSVTFAWGLCIMEGGCVIIQTNKDR